MWVEVACAYARTSRLVCAERCRVALARCGLGVFVVSFLEFYSEVLQPSRVGVPLHARNLNLVPAYVGIRGCMRTTYASVEILRCVRYED